MKKLLSVLVLTFTISLSAQIGESRKQTISYIDIGDVYSKEDGLIKLQKTVSGNQYGLYYRSSKNASAASTRSLFFYATQEELDYLYNEFASVFTTESEEKKYISVGKSVIYYRKQSNSIEIEICFFSKHVKGVYDSNTILFSVSKNTLAKLFGKYTGLIYRKPKKPLLDDYNID